MVKMKAAVFMEPGKMEVHEIDHPTIEESTDAILKIVRACVCGSDLWWFRGINSREHGTTTGHEAYDAMDQRKAIKPLVIISE